MPKVLCTCSRLLPPDVCPVLDEAFPEITIDLVRFRRSLLRPEPPSVTIISDRGQRRL